MDSASLIVVVGWLAVVAVVADSVGGGGPRGGLGLGDHTAHEWARYCSPADHPDDCAALVALALATDVDRWVFRKNWLR